MPISGPASYLPTMAEFCDHWGDVNVALGAHGPLIIRKETLGSAQDATLLKLEALYLALRGQHAALQGAIVSVELARLALEELKGALLEQLNMLNERVRALLDNTRWARTLPEVPGIQVSQGPFTEPLNRALVLWEEIDIGEVLGPGAVLALRDGTLRAAFEAQLLALDPAYRELTRAEQVLRLQREARNDLQGEIYPILRQYRVTVGGYLGRNTALMRCLPRLTPERGHTPEPVVATGVWDAAEGKARIEWEASSEPTLAKYQVRTSPGREYHTEAEDVLATFTPEDPRVFLTSRPFPLPGLQALFKVYVILDTGNESGSDPVEIQRPDG